MAGQSIIRISERQFDCHRPPKNLKLVSARALPDTRASWSDCWPDNAGAGSAGTIDSATLKTNAPGRVLLEFAAVLAVVALAAVLANALI